MLRPVDADKPFLEFETLNLGKIKIIPFTSAVSSDYYIGINQPEEICCNTPSMNLLTETGNAIFFGDSVHE